MEHKLCCHDNFFFCTFLVSLSSFSQLYATDAPIVGKLLGATDVEIPEWFKDSFLDFRDDATEAAEEGKHMLVFADLKGCPYCAKMLHDNFKTSVVNGGNKEFIQDSFR